MKSYPIYLLYTMCIFTVVTHARHATTPPPTPIPNPTNLVGAVYQGKCGLGQIGVTMFSKASKDPATLKEIQGIMETQSTNIQNSCEKTCEMTTPNVAKFTQNSQAPLMVRNLMDSTSNGGITPASFPAIIPSKPCNCDVKLLSDVSIYCILILMIRKNKEKIRLTYISYIHIIHHEDTSFIPKKRNS